jgi:hypothetical protein
MYFYDAVRAVHFKSRPWKTKKNDPIYWESSPTKSVPLCRRYENRPCWSRHSKRVSQIFSWLIGDIDCNGGNVYFCKGSITLLSCTILFRSSFCKLVLRDPLVSREPSVVSSGKHTGQPTTGEPSVVSSVKTTGQPTGEPSVVSNGEPTGQPIGKPSVVPSKQLFNESAVVQSEQPSGEPSAVPSAGQPFG